MAIFSCGTETAPWLGLVPTPVVELVQRSVIAAVGR